jgi:GDP-mannose 6-dehydrogenase
MNVSIFGLGYVGTVTAACLAQDGHDVMGVDVNPDKVAAINNKTSPIIEPGLAELIAETVDSGRLKATQDVDAAVAFADICLVCVGTPSNPNGGLNMDYVERVCEQIGEALSRADGYKAVVLRSTILPGTVKDRVIPVLTSASGRTLGPDFGLAVNPEFLREGSAIQDFRDPPFTLIGQFDERSGALVAGLYDSIPAPIYYVEPDEASMVKYASNAFHALKVTFANEIGRLCKSVGVDSTKVMEVFVQDSKLNISPRYLRPGFAFGGSCLPKDIRAMLYLARHKDIDVPVLESVLPSNEQQIQLAVDAVAKSGKKRVSILGLSFKPDTDDLRESPMVHLAETLLGKGYDVRIFDENVNLSRLVGGNRAFIEQAIPHIAALMCGSVEEAMHEAEVLVIGHSMNDGWYRLLNRDQIVIDLVRIKPDGVWESEAEYDGICW